MSVNVPSKKENVFRYTAYNVIKDRIIHLQLRPGEKILEAEIAAGLNMSRTPVREALLMLEHEKLVECKGSTGFTVRRFSAREVEEYFAVRRVIEEFVMSLVLERITDTEVTALRQNLKEARQYVAGRETVNIIRSESEFHEILYRAAKSDVLFETISGLTDKFRWLRAVALNAAGGAAESVAEHEKILSAIERRDARALKTIVRTHLSHAEKKLAGMWGLLL
jgi:DNA-binding GntR family transcriptional regulator